MQLLVLKVELVMLYQQEHQLEIEIEEEDLFKKELTRLLSFHHSELMKHHTLFSELVKCI